MKALYSNPEPVRVELTGLAHHHDGRISLTVCDNHSLKVETWTGGTSYSVCRLSPVEARELASVLKEYACRIDARADYTNLGPVKANQLAEALREKP